MINIVFEHIDPGAAALTDLFVQPADTVVIAQVIVANRGAATAFRIALAPGGEADDPSHYIAFDKAIGANEVYTSPVFTIQDETAVRVYATLATLTFTLSGIERA